MLRGWGFQKTELSRLLEKWTGLIGLLGYFCGDMNCYDDPAMVVRGCRGGGQELSNSWPLGLVRL